MIILNLYYGHRSFDNLLETECWVQLYAVVDASYYNVHRMQLWIPTPIRVSSMAYSFISPLRPHMTWVYYLASMSHYLAMKLLLCCYLISIMRHFVSFGVSFSVFHPRNLFFIWKISYVFINNFPIRPLVVVLTESGPAPVLEPIHHNNSNNFALTFLKRVLSQVLRCNCE